MCEQDISRMRRQLDETNDELAQIARERDILAHENDNLQEQFGKAKQENQVCVFLESFLQEKKIHFF
jgi:regulator of replication initiation timing